MKTKLLFLIILLSVMLHPIWGQTNKALNFTGGKNYVNIPHFATPQNLSIEAWIRTTQSSTGTIVSWKDAKNNGDAIMFRIRSGKLEYGEWLNGWHAFSPTTMINTGSWIHVAAVRGNNSLKLYINGTKILENNTLANTSPMCKSTAISIGAIQTNALGDVTTSESFVGDIDEIRIWEKQLTAAEINQNMLKSIPSDSEGLKAYFNFDDNTTDQTANKYNGNCVGSLGYVVSDIFKAPTINSLSFTEEFGNMPYINANANMAGSIYWAIVENSTTAPTAFQIEAGTGFISNGTLNYIAAGKDVIFKMNGSLTKGSSYKVHAILKIGSNYSAVFSSNSFIYQEMQQLPQGWFNTDIGSTGIKGLSSFSNGEFTVSGSGGDINGNKDAFQYVCTTRNGTTELIAKFESQQNTNSWAKSGIMIRVGLEENAAFVMMGMSPNGLHFAYRNEPNWGYKMQFNSKNVTAPIWLRLVYKDGYALGYWSADGTTWSQVKYPVRMDSKGDYYAGMVSCSHDNNKLCATKFSNITVKTPDQAIITNEKGSYFGQKNYINDPIPVWGTDKDKLPSPILDGNPEWINLYWKSWELAFKHISKPLVGSNYVSNFYDDAFNDDIFQWDIIFMTMFGRYANHLFPAVHSFNNFYANQHKDGLIVRQLSYKGDDTIIGDSVLIFPPLFSWAEMENYLITGNKKRLEEILPALEKYYDYIERYHRGWDTEHQLYWTHGYASGMDNTPRDNGRPNGHMSFDHQGWTDLSCQMVIQAKNIARMFKELGNTTKETEYIKKADDIAVRINKYMWNDTDGLYYDVDVDSKQTNHKTAACFWPMLAGISSKEQEAKMIANLKDPNTFWRDMIFPTLAADQPEYKNNGGYWLGGVWAPTNYAIIKGLLQQGYHSFAKEASEKYIVGMSEVFKSTGTIWENYAPQKKNGIFMQGVSGGNTENFARYDFVGWSGLGPISLLIESVIGIDVDGVGQSAVWHIDRLDRNGVKNLNFGGIISDFLCQARETDNADAYVQVKASKAFKLTVYKSGKEYKFDVLPGENNFVVSDKSANIKSATGKNTKITIYPNPASEKIVFSLNDNKSCDVKISNMLGHVVLSATVNEANLVLDISSLSPGNFWIEIKNEQLCEVKKLIIK